MKRKLFLCIMMLMSIGLFAQNGTELKGRLVNSATNEPVKGVSVTIQGQNHVEVSDDNGQFHFKDIDPGVDVISIISSSIVNQEFTVALEKGKTEDLSTIKVVVTQDKDMGLVNLVDENYLDEEGSNQQISSTIIMSNDLYLKKAGFQMSSLRFRVRGYDDIYQEKFLNGVNFNDLYRGKFNYSAIGALNDVTRNGDAVNYYDPNTFTFGDIGGSENVNMRAANFSRGGKVTMSYTNRNYYLRSMASYSTGLMDDGYAFTVALGGRYADEGNTAGTFYRNFSFAFSGEKQFKDGEHSISLVAFGSPVQRGQQHATYGEVYDLVGDNLYNPDWGYQSGKKRNSRVVKAFDPTVILSHIWKINENVRLTTGIGAHFARYGASALNWYDGSDPRPDYYRKLPSYFAMQTGGNPTGVLESTLAWKSKDPSRVQLNWDELIRQNQEKLQRGEEGAGAAIYMMEERRSDLKEYSMNSTLNANLFENRLKLTAGFGLKTSTSEQFKTVKDLLGSKYVLDVDKFAERDFPADANILQNDMQNPNRKVITGDKFGYDFDLKINSANLWFTNEHKANKFDVYYGAKFTYTDFRRTGKMQNGRYANSSLGKGKTHKFMDFALKGGLTYKFNGRHFITGNVSFKTEAPLPYDAYITPRISDITQNLESAKIFSADVSYVFSLPQFSGRVTAYHTNFYDMMKKWSYYVDGASTFMHHTVKGMNKINRGVEVAMSYQLNDNWSFDMMATMAEYFYNNNPTGIMSYENGSSEDVAEKVYLKDYYVGGTPQFAGTFGINYFNDYWFLNLNVNAFGRNYIDLAPIRRLESNYVDINPNNPSDLDAYNKLTHQERYGSGYTLDFSLGKLLFLKNGQRVNVNLAFNNILNRKNVKTGGYEQGRLDIANASKFQSKYFFMQGFNCFLNASYQF